MPLIRILIADKDKDYCLGLAEYLANNPYRSFEILVFTEEIELIDCCTKPFQQKDIILLNENFKVGREIIAAEQTLIMLVEKKNNLLAAGNTIFKYQCGDELLKKIIEFYLEENHSDFCLAKANKLSLVVAVCSPSGGTGKTILASTLSVQAALEGKRVFYLNLEDIASTELFFSSDAKLNISGVLYHLKHSLGADAIAKITPFISTDAQHKVHYFKGPDNMLDIQEGLKKEIGVLLELLLNVFQYECIFIDMGSGLSRNSLSVLGFCHHLLLLCLDDVVVKMKTGVFLHQLKLLEDSEGIRLLDKTKLILNKYAGANVTENAREIYCGKNIYTTIPYNPELLIKQDNRIKPNLNSDFGTAVYRLYRGLCS